MEKKKSAIAKVPKEHTFHVSFYSEIDDHTYEGGFTVKKPSIIAQAKIEGRKSELLGGRYFDMDTPGSGVPPFASTIAEAIAFMENTVVRAPDWFDLDDVSDPLLLFEIYEEAGKVDPFRKMEDQTGDGGGSQSTGTGSSPKPDDSGPSDILASMVDEEIPTPGNK